MNETPEKLHQLPKALLSWYDDNARVLPWRQDPTAYHVWVSEIMLQQTRVGAVLPYYHRFMEALPDVCALAEVPEEKLMKLWEGLGYYSRARNLQKAAKKVIEEYDGVFPDTYEALLTLPGIGDYTAGAVASIAFRRQVPAVDGNVLRVLARILGDDGDVLDSKVKARFRAYLCDILPEGRAGDFNQAMMDLGAMVCLPNGAPKCEECPVRGFCTAKDGGLWRTLPVKKKKAPRRKEEKTVFVLLSQDGVALRKRPETGLLAGLWEFPHVEGLLDEDQAAEVLKGWGLVPMVWKQQLSAKHIFTHVEWHMRGYVLAVKKEKRAELVWTDKAAFADTAIPSAFAKFTAAVENEWKEMKAEP